MAHDLKLATESALAEATALAALLDGGFLRIYSGAKPATANTAITTQVLLAELALSSPAYSDITAGVITFDTITSEDDAPASGTATWFRVFQADGTTPVFDGTVGTGDCDVNLPTVAIAEHDTVPSVGTLPFTHTIPLSA